MIDFIYLKKTGLYTRFTKKYSKIDKPISYYLHHTPVFEKDFTVLHLMQILKEHEKEVNLVFMAYTRGFEIAPYYEEMSLPIKKAIKNRLISLEYSWKGEIYNRNEFGKPKYEIDAIVAIMGKAISNNNPGYSMHYWALNEIKETIFKLNSVIEFSNIDYGDIWEKARKIKKTTFFKGVKEFTFENIVGTFLRELTIDGYPEQIKELTALLKERIKQSKNEVCTPHEVIQLHWSKESLTYWQKKKDSKNKTLKIEKLEKEIDYLEKEIERMKIEYKDRNYNYEY
jgi:hypothetical protein